MQIVRPLSETEIERIHATSLKILEEVGVRVEHGEMLARFRAVGAKVNEANSTVRIPALLMQELLTRVPSRYTICQVDGTEDVVALGSKLLTGGLLQPKIIDWDTGCARPPRLADVRRNNILCQKIPAFRSVQLQEAPIPEDHNASPGLLAMEEYLANNSKHMFIFGTSMELLGHYRSVMEMIAEFHGVQIDKLATVACPIISPLRVPQFHGEFLLRCCEAGFAVCGTMNPISGATGPYSLAGNVALGNAENLFVLAVTQMVRPGSPFLYMLSPSVLDMRNGGLKFYSMDKVLARNALGQLAAFYNVPFIIDCGGSMTGRFDMQSGAESLTAMLTAYSVNPSWMGALGSFFNALGHSSELMLIHLAWLEVAKFLNAGIRVDNGRLALDSVKRVGPGGEFLTDELTVAMLREEEFFANDLFDLTGSDTGKSMFDRAHDMVDQMTAEFESPLHHALQEKLRRYFHDARKKRDAGSNG